MVSISNAYHEPKSSAVRPSYALVFYQDGEIVHCATKHSVRRDNTLSIGQVISPHNIVKLCSSLTVNSINTGSHCIPESVIYDSPSSIMWYKKRCKHPMWFRVGVKPERLYVEWPPLLFRVNKIDNKLYVFALSSNKRPDDNTRLYHAPLMNIDESGLLCQGTAHIPHDISFSSLNDCEDALIESQFTHVNHDLTLKENASNEKHLNYWRKKAQTSTGSPARVLTRELHFSQRLSQILNLD